MAESITNDAIWDRLGQLTHAIQQVGVDRADTREDRKAIYQKLEDQATHLDQVERAMVSMLGDIKEMKNTLAEEVMPAVNEYRSLKFKAAGVALALLFIGSVASAAAGLFLDKIKLWLGL